ncbi:MAG: ZIP family metal transporter [Candidatus Micrarchaeia archaeon]
MSFLDVTLGAGMAFVATALGAAGVFGMKKTQPRHYSLILAFAAGVMVFSAAEMLGQSYSEAGQAYALAGFLCGMAALLLLERMLPHAHAFLSRREIGHPGKKAVLVAGTIALHNIPEGFAIASAFALSPTLGWAVSVSIALQDIPEGLVTSAPLAYYGLPVRKSFLWGAFSGLVEFLAAVFGYYFLSLVRGATPFALAFSAGAMAYLVFFELLGESIRNGGPHKAGLAFLAGAAAALCITALLSFGL